MPSKMRMRKNIAVHMSLLHDGGFEANQGEIWDMIDEKKEKLNADAPTAAMGDIYDHEEDAIDDYMKHFKTQENQVGILVMINGEVIGCDCFGKHDTLSKTFSKLIKSYVLDAIDADAGKKKYSFSKEKADGFVGAVRSCLTKERSSVSMGTDVRLASKSVIGAALTTKRDLIHLTAFARDEKEDKRTGFYQRASRRKRH